MRGAITLKRPVYFWDDLPIVWPMMDYSIGQHSVRQNLFGDTFNSGAGGCKIGILPLEKGRDSMWPGFQKAL